MPRAARVLTGPALMQLTRIFFGAKIVGQIAGAGFQRGLGHAHDVVVRHDFLRAVVGHGDNAAAFGHERRGFAGQGDQGIGADVVRDAEGFAGGVEKCRLRALRAGRTRRSGGANGVCRISRAGLGKDAGDVLVLGDVAGQEQGIRAEGAGEFLDIFLEPFALVSEGQRGAGVVPGLGDGPGDGTFVGHADHQSDFSV